MCLTTMHFAHAILLAILFASMASPKLSTISLTEGREKGICAGVSLGAREQRMVTGEVIMSREEGRGVDHKQVKEVAT
jgi:hypothetical protein